MKNGSLEIVLLVTCLCMKMLVSLDGGDLAFFGDIAWYISKR